MLVFFYISCFKKKRKNNVHHTCTILLSSTHWAISVQGNSTNICTFKRKRSRLLPVLIRYYNQLCSHKHCISLRVLSETQVVAACVLCRVSCVLCHVSCVLCLPFSASVTAHIFPFSSDSWGSAESVTHVQRTAWPEMIKVGSDLKLGGVAPANIIIITDAKPKG